jgi:hypothetical protein
MFFARGRESMTPEPVSIKHIELSRLKENGDVK